MKVVQGEQSIGMLSMFFATTDTSDLKCQGARLVETDEHAFVLMLSAEDGAGAVFSGLGFH
jgi:hypothetical protein